MSVRHALLSLLAEGPKYGLRLRQEFEASTGELWPLNIGQVYTTLQRLERDGLIESDDAESEGGRRRFRLTEDGARELTGWLTTPQDAPPPRDELVIKVLVAARIPGVDVHEVIQTHRLHLIETMQHYTKIKAEAAEDDLPLVLVVDAELYRLDGIVRWLDSAHARLRNAPQTAATAPLGNRKKVRR